MKRKLDPNRIEVMDAVVAEIIRRKTPAERVGMICDAHETARQLVTGGVKFQHPQWGEEQVQAEVNRRLLGESA